MPNINHRFGRSAESDLRRTMSYRNLIVILQDSIAIPFENGSNTFHPKSEQFGETPIDGPVLAHVLRPDL